MINENFNDIIKELTRSISINQMEMENLFLSAYYRGNRDKGQKLNSLSSDSQRLAYLISRAPATYAAVVQVLMRIQGRMDGYAPSTLLDIGSGPGTALWAALEVFPEIQAGILVERDRGFIALSQKIAKNLQGIDLKWVNSDFTAFSPQGKADLVIASYSLGELADAELAGALSSLWQATGQVLAILEPGTPVGFSRILKMRQFLIDQGAHLLAPCPHAQMCPLPTEDWCHFSARVERSSLHRKLKGGSLNYEDEKYCYLVFSKEKIERCQSRIVRHPLYGSGFVKFKVCAENGLEEKTITKNNKEDYKNCRKLKWGDDLK